MRTHSRTRRRRSQLNNSEEHAGMLGHPLVEGSGELQSACCNMFSREFLQRYSLMSSAIKEVPPGEVVFNLDRFGQIFDQKTLDLRKCMVNPQGTAQKTLLW